jgi:hypothetical protein
LETDAEHQQDDADFRKLFGERRIGNEPRGMGSDERTCQQVTDNRGQADALGDVAQKQRSRESAGEREDQVVVVQGVSIRRRGVGGSDLSWWRP